MADKYKVDLNKPPEPIQLKDASGPPIHELSDERNYEFLNKLFKMKELDPFAKEGYSVDNVYQLMDKDLSRDITSPFKKDKSKWTGYGQYGPHLADLIYPLKRTKYKGGIKEQAINLGYEPGTKEYTYFVYDTTERKKVFKDYIGKEGKSKGKSLVLEDIKKYRPDLLKGYLGAKDVIAQYDKWNTEQGLGTLIHEMRHKAFDYDLIAHGLIKDNLLNEEIFNRVMDVKYGDERTGKNAKRFIKEKIWNNPDLKNKHKLTSEDLDEMVESIIKYGNNLEDRIIREKFDAKED